MSMEMQPPTTTPRAVPRWIIYGLLLGVLGFAAGLPLSYWFQPGLLRMVVSFPEYTRQVLSGLTEANGKDPFNIFQVVKQTMLFSTVGGLAVGALLGAMMDSRRPAR